MNFPRSLVGGLILLLAAGCSSLDSTKSDGWTSLFDGQTFAGWRAYGQKAGPALGWEIRDGMLKTLPKVKGAHALVTERKYNDFELSWDWRIALAGNNGIKYLVTEERPGAPGHEYQMIDDRRHPDAKYGPIRQTGSFYDVLPPIAERPTREAGEWNNSRIVIRGPQVEHWLNGKKILTYQFGSPELKAGLAKSKFAKYPDFGQKIAGHIMLTYHSDECWFKNIRIRELK
jgi:hypothetical protein